ncbi:FAD-dependent oxidoreductase [Siccirubricoccus sp. G192]|uniref:FAD-dependent oxidoreductase n=1 Tax=Siccirubricoccus sp. G192 TaxID=2849651 RepID=UPI001C2C70F9|nr:FAD-dependent oxidoreductase [Siccirubricoccus sp. G192]MBV1799579.1 FAD-dependent oxidoreductase [Siccirubricoccus sp. G192]
MGGDHATADSPDLTGGVALSELPDGGMLAGHVGEEAVLLARRGEEVFAIGASCTHYGGPLAEGLLVDETVRCPWHHACFSLRTGEALRAPAFDPVPCWRVEQRDGRLFVREKLAPPARRPASAQPAAGVEPGRIVIVGGGAAGFAAAEMLRREGYAGSLTLLSAEDAAPYDRPNLSKDYLAGTASEDWIPLRPESFYAEQAIDLRLGATVAGIDPAGRRVVLAGSGGELPFDRLLLATGAEPVRPPIPGADGPQVRMLRSLRDSRALIEAAKAAQRAVLIGAGFIGLEVAASLRARGLVVHVVAPERLPLERVLGPELGALVRRLHEEQGVVFHLEEGVAAIEPGRVRLKGGGSLDAELVVLGTGVRPRTELAERAGLAVDHGVLVDEYLETSAPGIFAAGDIARWPDPHTGERLRIEHWVVAERQGQTAALNMLGGGGRARFTAAPFFWSRHYDTSIGYVGHAQRWDATEIEGDIGARDAVVRYRQGGQAPRGRDGRT